MTHTREAISCHTEVAQVDLGQRADHIAQKRTHEKLDSFVVDGGLFMKQAQGHLKISLVEGFLIRLYLGYQSA